MRRRGSRPSRPTGAYLVLVVAMGLAFMLPLGDHHAAERDPWHDHLAVGARGIERTRAISAHRHEFERDHDHDRATGRPLPTREADRYESGDLQVVAIRQFDSAMGAGVGLWGQALLSPAWQTPHATQPSGRQLLPAAVLFSGITLAIDDPPPRAASS